MLRVVNTPSLGDQVFDQLCAAIISGEFAAGEYLAPERELLVTFGVNRHVVRGAIQRLEQIHLVKCGRGGRTVVLDYRRHGGLDLLYMLTKHVRGRQASARMWLSALQLRATIGVDVLRLCALSPDERFARELSIQTRLMQEESDDFALSPLYGGFWDVALEGAGNLAYRMAFNGLRQSAQSDRETEARFLREELEANRYYGEIVASIAAHDGEATERAARDALRFQLAKFAAVAEQSNG